MKFIHAADLHLDSPFLGLTNLPNSLLTVIRQSTFAAATKVFDRAINEHVDFVVLAGDLFDRSEQSVAAQAYLFEQFDRLRLANIPVFVNVDIEIPAKISKITIVTTSATNVIPF